MDEQTPAVDSAPDAPTPRTRDATTPSASRHAWIEWVRQAWRAVTLRSVQSLPEGPAARTMLLLVAATAAMVSGASRLEVHGPASFDLRSWLFSWAPAALLLFGAWLALNWTRAKNTHASPVAAWYLLFSLAMFPVSLVSIAVHSLELRGHIQWWTQGRWFAWAFFAALVIWMAIATWRVSRAVTRSMRVATSLLVYVAIVQVLSSWQLATQVWQPAESNDADEFVSLTLSQDVFEAQQALLQKSLQSITPAAGSERQVYGLVYAPYSEDVFLRESAMVQQVLEERFGAGGHIVRLVNNATTATQFPWATPLNLERTLRALAEAMDTERDVLVVYLTSHGGADFKLAAQNWPLEVDELTAIRLRTMLDDIGIRHRVIAVSACYSGGWIEPLRSDDTLIMTAADKDHTSYGCGSKSDLTFFGRAVFDEQLRKTLSFEAAFHAATPVIKQREIEAKKNDGFSNPQIAIGGNIRGVLDELTRATSVAGVRGAQAEAH